MMAETETDQGFEGDQETATTTSFSRLLFGAGDDDNDVVGLDLGQSFNYTCSSKTPKMLCFGGNQNDGQIVFGEESAISATKKTAIGVACSDSSSASSGNKTKSNNIKRNGDRESMGAIFEVQPARRRTNKKSKVENPATSTSHEKVRKEKLGDRITALQQLVSPFGKVRNYAQQTDTASVLHEAMGYIRFLHDQVQVLCSPYLQHPHDYGNNGGEESMKELKSRGLCLVPVACTVHVANSNGADFWSPAMGNDLIIKD